MSVRKNGLIYTRALGDLARSGLRRQHAKKMGINVLTAKETTSKAGIDSISYAIPYYTITGKRTDYTRLRILDPPITFSKPDKERKYWQPAGTLPRLYFAPLLDWTKVATDVEAPIYITEGEKKAARACLDGIPTVGLGGVWSWRSARQDKALINDFDDIAWTGRTVIIVFDSDVAVKREVQQAMVALAKELVKLGAIPQTVKLPAGDDQKVGLDDYLEQESKRMFLDLPVESLLGGLGAELWKLNNELSTITNPASVYHISSRQLLSSTTLVKTLYANRNATIFIDAQPKRINLAAEWLLWPFRREHTGLTYSPGEPEITGDNHVNTWRGWAVKPKRGDIAPFQHLVKYLFKNDPQHERWFWQWLAYPLQHPGAKLYTACVFFSLATGVGKSLVGLTMKRIYGQNFSEVSQEDLHAGFNDWAAEKQFVLGDDVTGSDKRRDADRLKVYITRQSVLIDKKYQPKYNIKDCTNYLFTTNQPDAFFLDAKDRRYFVLEVPDEPLPTAFYKKYDAWYKSDAGASALFEYLLNQVDCTKFEPHAHAPSTVAKADMVDLSRSDVDAWTHQLRDHPDSVLRIDGKVIQRDLWTCAELKSIYDPLNERKTTLISLAKGLRRAGFKMLPMTTTLSLGPRKLFAVRDEKRWLCAEHADRAAEYDKNRIATGGDGKVIDIKTKQKKF